MNIALAAGYSSGLQGRRSVHQSGALRPRGPRSARPPPGRASADELVRRGRHPLVVAGSLADHADDLLAGSASRFVLVSSFSARTPVETQKASIARSRLYFSAARSR